VTSLPERSCHPPITSHTSLHAYWNDPNFDTQSQISNSSSATKKRRAPRPPSQSNAHMSEQQQAIDTSHTFIHSPVEHHHESHESLTDSSHGSKQKRKAPVLSAVNSTQENNTIEPGRTSVNKTHCRVT
jgi:hypothetical protein